MKPGQVVCNYAIVRFLPYPETSEFVNLGVIVACPALRYFGYRLEMQKRDRVTGFFPEMNPDILIQGRKMFAKELDNIRKHLHVDTDRQPELAFSAEEFSRIFREVVKPRESLFRFSSPGTRLAESPDAALDYLYGHYVERMFAKHPEYQEVEMARRLRAALLERHIRGFRAGRIGNDMYEVAIPLLRRPKEDARAFRAIKPLDLNKEKPTLITMHGDDWLARMAHLKDMEYDASRVLFAVRMPEDDDKRRKAAETICIKLRDLGAVVESANVIDPITDFAKAC